MVLDPIPQPLPVHFFGSRPQPPTSLHVHFAYFIHSYMSRLDEIKSTLNATCICDTRLDRFIHGHVWSMRNESMKSSAISHTSDTRLHRFIHVHVWIDEACIKYAKWHTKIHVSSMQFRLYEVCDFAYEVCHFACEVCHFACIKYAISPMKYAISLFAISHTSYMSISHTSYMHTWRGGGLGSRPKKMYGERLGDGVEYHLMSPTPRC